MKEQKNQKRNAQIKSNRIVSVIVFAVMSIFILVLDVLLLVNHDRAFSETENRVLQTAPELTAASLTSGRFMTDAEKFTADQIAARDTWIQVKLLADKLEGKKESNGVYLGKEGYLIEIPKEPNETYMKKSVEAIRDFAQSHDLHVVMSLIPNISCVCPQLLPDGAPVADQAAAIRETKNQLEDVLIFTDITEALSGHRDEPIYYHSDHHWTSLGARYAFESMASDLNIDPSESNYSILQLTDAFHGTMASASGDFPAADSIEAYIYTEMPQYVIDYPGSVRERSASMYVPEALETQNQYEVFLGGNYPLITINTSLSTGRRLLLLKDSYANSFLQFLLPWYDMIQIVDPRYYTDDLEHLIDNNSITDVLILYNMNTFADDRYLSIVLS